jgi:methyl-accepting chemotaxis protein
MMTSVRGKLIAGFGAVLLLTALLTWSALYNVNQLATRSQSLVDSISLDSQIAKIRLQEHDFDRAMEASAVEAFHREIERFDQIVASVQSDSGDRALASVQRIKTVRGSYQDTFNHFVAARRHAQDAQHLMTPVIGKIKSRLEHVTGGLFDALASDPVRIGAALQSAVKLQSLTATLQDQVDSYVQNPTDDAHRMLSSSADSIRQQGNDLWEQLPNENLQQLLEEALSTVLVYQDQVAQFRQDIQTSLEAKAQMLAQAKELQTLGDTLYRQHVEGRQADVRFAQWFLFTTATLTLLLGLGAAWLITRQIIPPLNRALLLARQIASGDVTGERKTGQFGSREFSTDNRDEIGQMMTAMQDMAEQLRQIIGRIGGGAERLTSAAQALSVITTQNDVGAGQQREQTSQVAVAVADMVASAQHVAQNARDTSHATEVTEQRTVEGDQIIAQALLHFDQLLTHVTQCSTAMTRLRHDSEQIDGVLGVIREVADQTNLLALNAAIEAARAGESGRGFAVVADEVRSLAQRTQQSTQEIEQLILSLQNGARDATALMAQSESMSHSSVELARAAGQVLSEIRGSVASIHSMNLNIAAAADQQTEASKQISSRLVQVRDIADESVENSLRTSEASAELSRLSIELTALVQRFKVT